MRVARNLQGLLAGGSPPPPHLSQQPQQPLSHPLAAQGCEKAHRRADHQRDGQRASNWRGLTECPDERQDESDETEAAKTPRSIATGGPDGRDGPLLRGRYRAGLVRCGLPTWARSPKTRCKPGIDDGSLRGIHEDFIGFPDLAKHGGRIWRPIDVWVEPLRQPLEALSDNRFRRPRWKLEDAVVVLFGGSLVTDGRSAR